MGDQIRIPRVVIYIFSFLPFVFQGERTAELPSLCNVVSSLYQPFVPHFAMTVLMCILYAILYLHYRINKQQDPSFEFSSILSTIDLSKYFIKALIIRKFIQLVNFVTFSVFFFFFGNRSSMVKPVWAGSSRERIRQIPPHLVGLESLK